jgi:hypothetical protein
MQFTLLAITSLIGLTLASPNTLLNKRDKFDKCSVFGSNCATNNNRFCDPDTGKMSVCHQFGDDCWVRYTMDSCASKREREPTVQVEKRDLFNKCSTFGSICDVDRNEFCDSNTGKMSVCHQIGWGSGECWIRYTNNACPAKREAAPEPVVEKREPVVEKREPVEKRDLFNKCASFGADCATDYNTFCRNGRQAICHQIGWGTDDCWIQYTPYGC